MRGLRQHLDDHVGTGIGSSGMGWKNRLPDPELVRHGTPRLENRTGTRAWTAPLMTTQDDRRALLGLEPRRCSIMTSTQLAATFPLLLTYVNCFAETGPSVASCFQQPDEQFQGFGQPDDRDGCGHTRRWRV